MVITRLCKYFHRSKEITILSYPIFNWLIAILTHKKKDTTQILFIPPVRKRANTKNASHATR